MSVLLAVALVVAAGLVVAVAVFGLVALAIGPSAAERVARAQFEAQRAVDRDHQAARRAMNDAAGQSWRNLAD
ncbi:hypothetical protein [Curtobacterium sp. B18]|uniref:hypothetical protein n=1 Tax=Curtobacterium sp. B18 TaxID=95614 RepID=UPI0011D1A521|nr:hypothetical protein [Curtobacterium sp. B18]